MNELVSRSKILNLEQAIIDAGGAVPHCPVKHFWAEGMYGRAIFLPAGSVVVGKLHKHGHPNYIVSGHVAVYTEFDYAEMRGPLVFQSLPGTKRVVFAIEDTVWITYHKNPSNTRDLLQIEREVIATSYTQLPNTIKSEITL